MSNCTGDISIIANLIMSYTDNSVDIFAPVTLTLPDDLDLDILVVLPKVKFVGQGIQKLEPEQDRHTHALTDVTERITTPHLRVVE